MSALLMGQSHEHRQMELQPLAPTFMRLKKLRALARRLGGPAQPSAEIGLAQAFASRPMKSPLQPGDPAARPHSSSRDETGQGLAAYFNSHLTGRGIWKWSHYFEIYERHLAKYVGLDSHILEVGIYSGGSLQMWRKYFGSSAHIVGVDIEEACRAYEESGISIEIGDQADPSFWSRFRHRFPKIDVLIDDGGHTYEQQRITLEEMLPHIQPGGVYICEDIHGGDNQFASYVRALAAELNKFDGAPVDAASGQLSARASSFQRVVGSVHFYPFVAVIERNLTPVETFTAPKHGTEWEPFL
jgi:hypothetical protein